MSENVEVDVEVDKKGWSDVQKEIPYGWIKLGLFLLFCVLGMISYALIALAIVESQTGNDEQKFENVYDYSTKTYKTTWYKALVIIRYIAYGILVLSTLIAFVTAIQFVRGTIAGWR